MDENSISLMRSYDPSYQWQGEMKPREKLFAFGAEALTDYELMAILIGSGSGDRNVTILSKEVVNCLDANPFPIGASELTGIKGIGNAKATLIIAALEYSRRIYSPRPSRIFSPADTYCVISHYADHQENFIAISLNGANEILSVKLVSKGTVNKTLVHPREVFAGVIGDRATSLIIAHNHPSGNLSPSPEDQEVTKRIIKAGKVLGIPLLDHIIFSPQSFFSFTEHNLL